MKKKIIYVVNWDRYQARSDKEMPWFKLWGGLFKRPWFQALEDCDKFCTIALLDLARQFNNRITENLLFNGYLSGNYGILRTSKELVNLCKYLCDNEFLSDNCRTIVGHTREDKRREDTGSLKKGKKRPSVHNKGIFNAGIDKDGCPFAAQTPFSTFWAAYPRKKNIAEAERAFNRLNPDHVLLEVIMDALGRAKKSRDWNPDEKGVRYIPLPANWIKNKRWLDEYQESVVPKKEDDLWAKMRQKRPIGETLSTT